VCEHTVKKVLRSEEGINAELRQLTLQTRRLREELQNMIHPGARDRVRVLARHRMARKPQLDQPTPTRRRDRKN
jgi:hypothetical protein